MSQVQPNSSDKNSQVIRRESELAKLPYESLPALTEIIDRSLIHIQSSKTLPIRHRIGNYELCDPDYRMVGAWAEELALTIEDVMNRLMDQSDEMKVELEEHYGLNLYTDFEERRTQIVDGHIKNLLIVRTNFPVFGLPSIEGLKIEKLTLLKGKYRHHIKLSKKSFHLDFAVVSDLKILDCREGQEPRGKPRGIKSV